jgi:uncharacterized MAPEG superfamily protein
MAATPTTNTPRADTDARRPSLLRRLTTETKQAFKTTEFYVFLAAVVGVLIAGNSIEIAEGGTDYFTADKVWLYVTILTVGYMVSRGLAKSGSRDPYWDDRDRDHDRNGR